MQIMAEDDESSADQLTGLDDNDIKTNVYEGGFKSWECSIDLVRFLLDRGPRKDLDDLARVDHVIEVKSPSNTSLYITSFRLRRLYLLWFRS